MQVWQKGVVRLATWNCQTGLARNWAAVEQLNADVLTVQECEPETEQVVAAHPGVVAMRARAPVTLAAVHPAYAHEAVLGGETVQSLLNDLGNGAE